MDIMWDRAASCIMKTAREVLDVLRGRAGHHKGDWWSNKEVKRKVETKKEAYIRMSESKNKEEKQVNREIYKVAWNEAKLAFMGAKSTVFESLYVGLEEKSGEKRLFRLDKAREQKVYDLDQVKYIKKEDGSILVEDAHIKMTWQEYFYSLLNKERDKGFDFWELEHLDEGCDFSYCRHFKVEDVKEVIRRMQRVRATGG
ncbi:uncharacterized protein LOC107849170 [Capsicum annuum]|uniref:uncharacterized protein LOC107849170 n=1 Tax=Capsicum annuum TaxID=4072 RepID=UPI0007BF59CB|nr:uncharacterized protein LOC107849170 [Capsicum annuum]